MKTSNLLIIGGVLALGGYYFFNKNKKVKEKANELGLNLPLVNSLQTNTATSTASTTSASSKLLTDAEAKVYATRTIAQVNSLLTKYPMLKKEEFLVGYNAIHNTKLFVAYNREGVIAFPAIVFQSNATVSEKKLANDKAQLRADDAKQQFDALQITRNHWKTDFGLAYKDLKDYYATLTKEKANRVVRFLPKVIVQAILGDSDARAKTDDFFNQEEQMQAIDSKIDFETELKNALKGFSINLRKYFANAVATTTNP